MITLEETVAPSTLEMSTLDATARMLIADHDVSLEGAIVDQERCLAKLEVIVRLWSGLDVSVVFWLERSRRKSREMRDLEHKVHTQLVTCH